MPSPKKNSKFSAFIFFFWKNFSEKEIKNIILKYFNKTHGKINIHNKIRTFLLSPHVSYSKENKFILIGDMLRSIHPVAGQGWNLGIKDIEELCSVVEKFPLDSQLIENTYYPRRIIESISYLTFTSFLNYL